MEIIRKTIKGIMADEIKKTAVKYTVLAVCIGIVLFSLSLIVFGKTEDNEIEDRMYIEATSAEALAENPINEFINMGEYRITAYCGCEKCCGKYGKNRPKDKNNNDIIYTASGYKAVEGVTIAADKKIPFGTKLYIDGHEYTVQDRGGDITDNCIDIYFNNHKEAVTFGVKYIEVFSKSN